MLGLDGEKHPRWREEALKLALDQTADRYIRGSQARNLALDQDLESLFRLLDDPEPLVWKAAVPALVYQGDSAGRQAVLRVLSQPDLENSVVRGLWLRDPSGVAWEAYQASGNLALLAYCCRIGPPEAQVELVAKLSDPDLDPSVRQELASQVWGHRLDPQVADGLEGAAEVPGAPIREIAQLLTPIAPDAAVPIWRRVFFEAESRVFTSDAAYSLRTIGTPRALDVLIEAIDTELPYPGALIDALGAFAEPRAAAAIASFLPNNELLLDVIYGLESQALPEAREILISLEHVQGWRALARLGDRRSMKPLLDASRSDDGELRREALEGLRELSNLTSAGRLAEILEDVQPESDEAAISAHALAVMRAPGVVDLLERLLAHSRNPSLQRVVSGWVAELKELP